MCSYSHERGLGDRLADLPMRPPSPPDWCKQTGSRGEDEGAHITPVGSQVLKSNIHNIRKLQKAHNNKQPKTKGDQAKPVRKVHPPPLANKQVAPHSRQGQGGAQKDARNRFGLEHPLLEATGRSTSPKPASTNDRRPGTDQPQQTKTKQKQHKTKRTTRKTPLSDSNHTSVSVSESDSGWALTTLDVSSIVFHDSLPVSCSLLPTGDLPKNKRYGRDSTSSVLGC